VNSLVEFPASHSATEKRARLAERLRRASTQDIRAPLSFAQQRLWFLDQLVPNTPLYNVPLAARLSGPLNVSALEKALQIIISRHAALRTRFESHDGTPTQVVSSRLGFILPVASAPNAVEAECLVREELKRPFNLVATEPLLRGLLVRVNPEEHFLALTMHHIVADEWSLKILFRELEELYSAQSEGRDPNLPDLPIQYTDYASWQRDSYSATALQEQLDYWKNQLAGKPPLTELMPDRPRSSGAAFNGRAISRSLEPSLLEAVKRLAMDQNATPFMLFLAALNVLIHRCSGLEDIIIGAPAAGRQNVETEGLIGFFVNTLLQRNNLAGNPAFVDLLRRVRDVALGAYARQELPFEKVIEALAPDRSSSHLIFTNIMFALQTCVTDGISLPGLKVECIDVDTGTSKFDLTLVVQDFGRGAALRAEYNSDLFDAGTVERLLKHFENLLRGIVANPSQRISELPLLDQEEHRVLLEDWNRTTSAYPSVVIAKSVSEFPFTGSAGVSPASVGVSPADLCNPLGKHHTRHLCIHEIFEQRAAEFPDDMAVSWGADALTYRELNERANQLARFLARHNIKPGDPVAIFIDRSIQMIVATLAILKAGGAYVPLDPRCPQRRLAFIIADTRASLVISQSNSLTFLPRHGVKSISLDADSGLIASESVENPINRAEPENVAYIIYTSGSTGQPKGVAVPHRAVVRLVVNTNYIELNRTDRIAQVSNPSFDAATFEIWGALLNGGQLRGIAQEVALSPRDFARELQEQGITAMFLTSALFSQMAAEVPGAFRSLRTLIAGGEALDPKAVRSVLGDRPPLRLLNGYGPTENTTFTCCCLLAGISENTASVPIGKPISNTQVYILDQHRQPVPVGAPGELYAGGDGLAAGYWNRPELTGEKFILHQFTPDGPCHRLYRTGDLARWLPDGNIEFLGRIDNQVKIRGFRVELGEIEAHLARHEGVRECAVKLCGDGPGKTRLAAFFVPAGKRVPKSAQLRAFLEDQLPDYMVPAVFMRIDKLPLTANGKVDRRSLPEPDRANPTLERKYASPRDAVELELTRIWQNVLGVDRVGIEDNFFELGGHSLLAVRIASEVEKAFGRKIRLAAIFAAPTVERLAVVVRAELRQGSVAAGTSLVELQPRGDRAPLFLVHGAGGGMFWGYVNLAKRLGSDQPVYGFNSRGLDGQTEHGTIEEMAAQYVRDLRVVQPRGPYCLGGYCFGGNVAYEMARQLETVGEKVALLALLNCAPPNSSYMRPRWTPRWWLRLFSNLSYWVGYCRQWTQSQRRDFLSWKWSALKRWLTGVFQERQSIHPVSESEDLMDLSSLSDEEKEIWQAHIRALMRFQPQPYSGRVHLFRSPGHPLWCSFEPDYGWGQLAGGGVAVNVVRGTHEKILEEPWVDETAADLRKALDDTRVVLANSVSEFPFTGSGAHLDTATDVPAINSLSPRSGERAGVRGADLIAVTRCAPGSAGVSPASVGVSPADLCNPPGKHHIGANKSESAEPASTQNLPIDEWNKTERDFPRDKTLIQLFQEQAARTPSAEALVCGSNRLTYAQLSQNAVNMAKNLRRLGAGSQSLVGICLERSEDMVAGILGTLLAGAAYVPLDPAYPATRLAFIAQNAKLAAVLTRRKLRGVLPDDETPVLYVEELLPLDDIPEPAPVSAAQDLAYVLYTSGSTGQPKGVAVEHRSAVAFVSWAREVFEPQEIAGVLAATSICFDLSVFELFVPLSCGGKVILAENALALPVLPAASEVTLINTVPSAIRELLRVKGVPASVRVVNLAGEPLTTELADQIYRETSVQKVYDLYGPTETTTYSTFALRRPGDAPNIGRPLANEQVYILDSEMRLLPIDAPGDLYIGGAGLARGYLNRPDLTAERFVPNPFKPGARLYKTGDIARWRNDGNLVYLGRADHQVKIRGFRVELGEIESALRAIPAVADALVIAQETRPGEKRTISYVISHPNSTITPISLRQSIKEKLPDYMVPDSFVILPKFPLTPNGKVDRQALPPPQEEERANLVAPRTHSEAQVAAAWSEVLDLKSIGVTENFFDLGGNSLLAIQVISRLRESLKIELPLNCLFKAPTIESMAVALSRCSEKETAPALTVIPRDSVLFASFMQEQLWFLHQMEPQSDAYNVPAGIRIKGPLDTEILEHSVNFLVRRHEPLRSTLRLADGNLRQIIHQSLEIKIGLIDAPDASDSEILRLLEAEARRPFDLEHGPLIRASIVRINRLDHALVIVVHHAVMDGWSLDVLFREMEIVYRALALGNGSPILPPLPFQFADYAHWQRQCIAGEVLKREASWWRETLAGAPSAVRLPPDSDGSPEPHRTVARQTIELPKQLRDEIANVARAEGGTPFMVLIAALAITLNKWTGQRDMVIGTVVAGRTRHEIEGLIGCFMNFIPLRLKISGDGTGLDALRTTVHGVIDAQAHQDCPFEKIVESLKVARRGSENPLYNVAFLFQNNPELPKLGNGLECAPLQVHIDTPLLDLRFEANETPSGLEILCEYKSELFRARTMELLLDSFRTTVEMLIRSPEVKLADLRVSCEARPSSPYTVTICGTFTTEPIEEPLRAWFDDLKIPHGVVFAPFGQVFQQLLDPGSVLAGNTDGLNVILIRLSDWDTENRSDAGPTHALKRNSDELVRSIRAASERGCAPVLVCFCPVSQRASASPQMRQVFEDLESALTVSLNQINGVYAVTSAELSARYPVAEYNDPASEALGRVPYTPLFFTALATLIARKYHALLSPSAKVIALDCDQTLWSGVCGEDGPNGVKIDPVRLALQQFMRHQQESGKLLVLCSKNDEADVSAVFDNQPAMPLRREHFSARRVNWRPKSENLGSIAQELGLGLDSFILIDDSPVECAEVEANCPGVLTLQLPDDPKMIPRFLEHCWAFDHLKTTGVDRTRASMYRQDHLRKQSHARATSFAEFISGLDLEIQISPVAPDQLERVAQLTQRTNQFNVSGRRRTDVQIKQLGTSYNVLSVSVKDRFGDYGLVGAMIFEIREQTISVDSFLLSCRALGRGVEHRMLAELGRMACQRGAQWLDVPFERLPRNQPALDFLDTIAGPFKQSNQFHIPWESAAAIKFDPSQHTPLSRESSPSDSTGTAVVLKKFTQCRAIALEAGDVTRIHKRVEARQKVRQTQLGGYVAPRTQLESQLCELWRNLLRVDRVGIEDDFFELGGHSLLAVRLFAELEKITGRKLPLVTLFNAPTIRQLATVACHEQHSESQSVLVPIQPNGSKPPLYLVHGAGGDVLWGYANLAAHMDPDQPIFGIKSCGQIGLDEFDRIEDMAACYLESVRAHQTEGPYYLGGYCFGGNVAYEMARQLKNQGEDVALLVLLDTAPANAGYETVEWWRPEFPGLFARNLFYWLRDFRDVKPAERRRFVGRKLRAIYKKLLHRMRGASEGCRVNLEEVIDPENFSPRELGLWQVHLQALDCHVQQPYSGHVTLIRTKGHPILSSFAKDLRWGALVRGGVTVNLIPGSHENIFVDPHVRALAVRLTEALARSQARVPTASSSVPIPA
jgi:amino acid adenylation domain-containing protein/FkbH-like protein